MGRDRALMTCLVFEREGRQVHFVDGADGGYALAAKAMKARMKRSHFRFWILDFGFGKTSPSRLIPF